MEEWMLVDEMLRDEFAACAAPPHWTVGYYDQESVQAMLTVDALSACYLRLWEEEVDGIRHLRGWLLSIDADDWRNALTCDSGALLRVLPTFLARHAFLCATPAPVDLPLATLPLTK